ncbi:putative damage-inducible protein DinB [Paractinoplanes brasiliensis]|uniref:Putative damage-inducible protein DinB n=2 Tax=Paractinoplanes brasiliensis TaxID=52695 RepID=A0A4R6JPS6_9ACTN|nr:putative damage-inducible protein DinB [Actinoplanes brasiliensis]GID31048.1 hypothetical protein Abr02nite_60310 [Actinoplanes brasiliensis]
MGVMTSQHVVGYNGMWAPAGEDPRTQNSPVDELDVIREYLTNYRLTLGLKCEGLSPEQLARRSVPPSTMSLLGLVRHMARVEHNWFHRCLQGHGDVPRLFWTAEDNDVDFNEATGDRAVVEDAFTQWRAQIAAADAWLDGRPDLGAVIRAPWNDNVSVRDVLIHMIEEYARHCGHADLIRECIDGRTGQ